MFHLALETAKNSKRSWSIEKRPLSPAHTLLGSPRNDSLLRDDDPNKDWLTLESSLSLPRDSSDRDRLEDWDAFFPTEIRQQQLGEKHTVFF